MLQYEMGITALSNSFGPTTSGSWASCTALGRGRPSRRPTSAASSSPPCTARATTAARSTASTTTGPGPTAVVTQPEHGRLRHLPGQLPVAEGGQGPVQHGRLRHRQQRLDAIRSIQQWLNGRYVLRKDFYIIPCDRPSIPRRRQVDAVRDPVRAGHGGSCGYTWRSSDQPSGLKKPHRVAGHHRGSERSSSPLAMILNKRSFAFAATSPATVQSGVPDLPVLQQAPGHRQGRLPDLGLAARLPTATSPARARPATASP
ncbi:hypothetical protein LV779_15550 [Streptomyces thinghirensis]|nr:hypothetical protein [Streptomyces thinghirensis]